MNEQDTEARIRTLILALKDEHVSVGWNAARELAKLGDQSKPALPALSESLRSHDANTALWARFAIARITGETRKHLPVFIEALEDRRVYPGMAAFALAGLGPEAAPATPRLIPQLSDSNPENRWSAAGALAAIGPEARQAVPALMIALQDPDEKTRWYAAWALGQIGPDSAPAVSLLAEALHDIDDDVRGYAARALGKIGPEARSTIPELKGLLEDENEALRETAREALTRLETPA